MKIKFLNYAFTVFISTWNYKKFNIYEWSWPVFVRLHSHGYHSKHVEFNLGRYQVEIEFWIFQDKEFRDWYL